MIYIYIVDVHNFQHKTDTIPNIPIIFVTGLQVLCSTDLRQKNLAKPLKPGLGGLAGLCPTRKVSAA